MNSYRYPSIIRLDPWKYIHSAVKPKRLLFPDTASTPTSPPRSKSTAWITGTQKRNVYICWTGRRPHREYICTNQLAKHKLTTHSLTTHSLHRSTTKVGAGATWHPPIHRARVERSLASFDLAMLTVWKSSFLDAATLSPLHRLATVNTTVDVEEQPCTVIDNRISIS